MLLCLNTICLSATLLPLNKWLIAMRMFCGVFFYIFFLEVGLKILSWLKFCKCFKNSTIYNLVSRQWFSTSRCCDPYSSSWCGDLNYKITSFLLPNCNGATVLNHIVALCYAGNLTCNPKGVSTHRLRDTGVKWRFMIPMFSLGNTKVSGIFKIFWLKLWFSKY